MSKQEPCVRLTKTGELRVITGAHRGIPGIGQAGAEFKVGERVMSPGDEWWCSAHGGDGHGRRAEPSAS